MKRLAMLLAICLFVSMLPVSALSETVEGEYNEYIEEMPPEAVGDIGVPGLIAEPEGDAPDEGYPEAAEAEDGYEQADAQPAIEDAAEGYAVEAALPEEGGSAPEAAPVQEEAPTPDAGAQQVQAAEETAPLPPHTDPNGPQLISYDITLGVGETFALYGAMPAGREGAIAYSSPDTAIAYVGPDGVVTAVAPGDVRLAAVAYDGTYAECDVHVRPAPDAVSFSVEAIEIGKGETVELPGVVLASALGASAGAYTVASSNPKIVKIDANGSIKGKKKGKAVITATTYNGLTASCAVTVRKAPGKVKLSQKKCTLGVGETWQIEAKLPKNTAGRISYVSGNTGVVAVDAAGLIQAVGPGTAKVTVSTYNGKKAKVKVTVLPAPQSLAFSATEIEMGVGMSMAFAASVDPGAANNIAYSFENPAVAGFKKKKLYALAIGETTLTATTYNGLSASCRIIVKPAPQYVALPYSKITLGVGESLILQPDVGDAASSFTYKSSSKKKVKVTADGVVLAKKKGKATITVTTYNKKKFKLKVVVQKEPTGLVLSQTSAELAIGEKLGLTASFAGTTYTSANDQVAVVDPYSGEVTAIAPGTTDIIAVSPNGKEARCTVTVCVMPEWMKTNVDMIELMQGQAFPLSVELSPGSRSPLAFTSLNPAVATVGADGVITGVGAGTAEIIVETNAPGVTAKVTVTVLAAPSWVKLEVTEQTLNVNDTTQMVLSITEGTVTSFAFASSDERVATVSPDGAVVAVGRGTATLTVTTANGLVAELKLTVLDPWYPETAVLVNAPETLSVGQSLQLDYVLSPASAVADFEWTSSNPGVVSVSGDGFITANAFGYAKITAQSKRNTQLVLELTLAVESGDVVLAIPARTTDVAGIPANLAMIDDIRRAAIAQIDAMEAGGIVGASDAKKRRSMVNNAFKDYAFPWMTPAYQAYWRKANSEGGVKDFQPDRVYYGLPYISGSGTNRQYNVSLALSQSRYTDSGADYYLLNQGNLLDKKYCGNDCSGFVSAAIWGNNSSHSSDRTTEIASSSAYKTIKGFTSMRTGDLICKSSAHVVMFLYYANSDKSKIMIIENGGIEPGTNTVHCIVMDVSYYKSKGYSVRRLASLG